MNKLNSKEMEKEIIRIIENTKFGVTAREVAEKLKIHRNTARIYLMLLERSGDIVGVRKGRVVVYFPKDGGGK